MRASSKPDKRHFSPRLHVLNAVSVYISPYVIGNGLKLLIYLGTCALFVKHMYQPIEHTYLSDEDLRV